MKILSIGNSFSQDAQRYLHALAKADGFDLQTTNLYIGGCTLQTHHKNMLGDLSAYELERNGESTQTKISIRSALESEAWDIVTVQQASHESTMYETYFPYLSDLVAYIRRLCPRAKVFVHETWPYENGAERLGWVNCATTEEMYARLQDCYARASEVIKADGIIRCGTAMNQAVASGLKIHRDTFHASLGAGRYMLALVWYKTLTGRDIRQNAFCAFDEPVSEKEREVVRNIADGVVK